MYAWGGGSGEGTAGGKDDARAYLMDQHLEVHDDLLGQLLACRQIMHGEGGRGIMHGELA